MQLLFLVALCSSLGLIAASPAHVGGIKGNFDGYLTSKGNDTKFQLQPEAYDNLKFGIANFFEYEVIYVENDHVLVWRAISGKWQLHTLNRECGKDCAIINEVPIATGFWKERKFHKLIFMGCHKSTGVGHVLEVDPSTGEYWVVLFDQSQLSDPMGAVVAHHQRIDMTEYNILYTGRDELLLYDGISDRYKIYLVEPTMPLSQGEDPIGPWNALDEGSFSLREQLVYVGNNHVMDYSPLTGEFNLYLYDRGATIHEAPFSHILTSGTIDKGLQLTFLAEHHVLGLDPIRGTFKAFNIHDTNQFLNTTDLYYGFGTLVDSELCNTGYDCSSCLAIDGCGWCDRVHSCLRGSIEHGPCTTNCTGWEMGVCPGQPCYLHRGCSACLADPFCGWCSDTNICTEGALSGPLFGSCSYSKTECPVLKQEETVGIVSCSEEIQ
jgi:hypothetical protein